MSINVETKSVLVKVSWNTTYNISIITWKATLEFNKSANMDDLIWFILDVLSDLEIDLEEIQEIEELLMVWHNNLLPSEAGVWEIV